MYRFIVIALLGLFCFTASGQSVSEKLSDEPMGKKGDVVKFLGYDSDGNVCYLTHEGKTDNVFKFNPKTLQLISEKEFTFESNGSHVEYEPDVTLISENGKRGFQVNCDKEECRLNVVKWDNDYAEGTINEILNFERNIVKKGYYIFRVRYKKADNYSPILVESPDSSKIALLYNPPDASESDLFKIHVFDNEMEELWTGSLGLEDGMDLNKVAFSQAAVSNDGSLFLSAYLYKKKEDRDNENTNFGYRMFKYTNGNSKPQSIEFDLEEGIRLFSANILEATNNEATVVGQYKEDDNKHKDLSANGIYYAKLDFEEEVVSSFIMYEFDSNFICKYYNDCESKKLKEHVDDFIKKNYGFRSYELEHVLFFDESIVLKFHNFYVWTSDVNPSYAFPFTAGDILIKFDRSTGEEIWKSFNDYSFRGKKFVSPTNSGIVYGNGQFVAFQNRAETLKKLNPSYRFIDFETGDYTDTKTIFNGQTLMNPREVVEIKDGESYLLTVKKGKKIHLGRIDIK